MEFAELVKTVGFGTAVCLRYEELLKTKDFFEGLDVHQWISILWTSDIPSELKGRARKTILAKAVTYADWARIRNNCKICPELEETAKQKMVQCAATVVEYLRAKCDDLPDFAVLRSLAKSAADWVSIANIAGRLGQSAEVENAVARLKEAPDPGCQGWVHISTAYLIEPIRKLALERIKAASISFNDLLNLDCGTNSDITDIIREKLLAGMDSMRCCRALWSSRFHITSGYSQKFFSKAVTLPQTFADWEWLKQINNHKDPFAWQIVQGMANTATTLSQWNSVFLNSRPEWPTRDQAFKMMKKLSG